MSLKIAVLSSLSALSAFRAHAPAGDQAQNLGPVGSQCLAAAAAPTTAMWTASAPPAAARLDAMNGPRPELNGKANDQCFDTDV